MIGLLFLPEDVEQIMDYLLEGEGKGQTYKRLSHVDEMGPRLSGTEALEDSIGRISINN